jgi:glycolate oxidase FAD binding subunit
MSAPSATAAPTSVEAVRDTVAAAAATGHRIRTRGSGSEPYLGYPVKADVVLDTRGLDWVRDFDPDELVIRVGVGMTTAALADLLATHRLRAIVPPGPRTVGGTIATGTSSVHRLRYGPIRNHVIGVTMVTGRGDVVQAGGQVVKNVTGYDLARLCVGSMGRLGVITEVAMRVYAVRGATHLVRVPDPEPAWRLPQRPLAVVGDRTGAVAIVDGSVDAAAATARRIGGTVDPDAEVPCAGDWSWRATVRATPSTQAALIAALPPEWDFVAQYGTGLTEVGGDRFDIDAILDSRARVEGIGGRFVIHDLPTSDRGIIDPWGAPPTGLDLQRRLIESFDPAGLFNPGILPGRL